MRDYWVVQDNETGKLFAGWEGFGGGRPSWHYSLADAMFYTREVDGRDAQQVLSGAFTTPCKLFKITLEEVKE